VNRILNSDPAFADNEKFALYLWSKCRSVEGLSSFSTAKTERLRKTDRRFLGNSILVRRSMAMATEIGFPSHLITYA
jgi:hypothetical protein